MTLKTTKLMKSFGNLLAVENLDLEVEKGQILGLVGPNGAGKTTTFNLLTGVLSPTAGQIQFEGQNITSMSVFNRAQIGIIRTFQENRVFGSLSVAKNVQLGAYSQTDWLEKHHKEEVNQVLKRIGLLERRDLLSKNLSHGELRRLQLGMALAAKPKTLLLDEPTAGLNKQETEKVMGIINELKNADVAIIIVEHDIDTVTTHSDKMIVLNNGRKIAEGSPSKVQNNERVIKAYLGGLDFA